MDKEILKSLLIDILKESGKLEIEVDEYGYVQISLSIDEQTILESNSIDLESEIKDAKSWKEAQAWT